MTTHVSPVSTHLPSDFHPPGVVDDDWGYLVSRSSSDELATFLADNPTVGQEADVRTPLLGSQVTYLAISQDQRDAALAAGATAAPSEGKCRRQAFDWSTSVTDWEP